MKKIRIVFLLTGLLGLSSWATDITHDFFRNSQTRLTIPLQAYQVQATLFGNRPATRIYLAAQKVIIGDVILQTRVGTGDKSYNYINELNVDKEYREKGLGSLLLAYALGQCTGDCVETRLTACPPSGTRQDYVKLKKFYERHGGTLEKSTELSTMGRFSFKPHPKDAL